MGRKTNVFSFCIIEKISSFSWIVEFLVRISVHYFWTAPFGPRSLDSVVSMRDTWIQVIRTSDASNAERLDARHLEARWLDAWPLHSGHMDAYRLDAGHLDARYLEASDLDTRWLDAAICTLDVWSQHLGTKWLDRMTFGFQMFA